jgi:hypothetical protein
MRVVKHLIFGSAPAQIELPYNGDLAADGTTTRYKGSLVKFMDIDDIDHGTFFTFAGLTTEMENVCAILEEQHTASYLPDDGTKEISLFQMTPFDPMTIIEAEYVQKDAAGTANTDTEFSGSAASTTLTTPSQGTTDCNIGAWIYFVTGANAGYLHYITDNNGTTSATLRTALVNDVVSADTVLFIQQRNTRTLDFNATFTDIKSECVLASRSDEVIGIECYVQADGIAKEPLDSTKHDGMKLSNAKFFHQFTIPNTLWVDDITGA